MHPMPSAQYPLISQHWKANSLGFYHQFSPLLCFLYSICHQILLLLPIEHCLIIPFMLRFILYSCYHLHFPFWASIVTPVFSKLMQPQIVLVALCLPHPMQTPCPDHLRTQSTCPVLSFCFWFLIQICSKPSLFQTVNHPKVSSSSIKLCLFSLAACLNFKWFEFPLKTTYYHLPLPSSPS